MGVNRDKPDHWKEDIAQSVDMYNEWFMEFAPQTFRETRIHTTKTVKHALSITGNLTNVSATVLQEHPEVLSTLRMATCPPLAVDRLIRSIRSILTSCQNNGEEASCTAVNENKRVNSRFRQNRSYNHENGGS